MPNTTEELPLPLRHPTWEVHQGIMSVPPDTMRRWTQAYARYFADHVPITWEQSMHEWRAEPPAPTDPNDGSEIGTVPHTNLHGGRLVWLYMGGQWLKGGWNRQVRPQCFCSLPDGQHSFDWDKANQPTRWKSLR